MINCADVYIYSDQPTTCPLCGSCTDIMMDLGHTNSQTQIHKCFNEKCKYEFIMQYDEDFDNGNLL